MRTFADRRRNVHRAYRNYDNGYADEDKVKREIELLIHTTWQRYGTK